MDSLAGLIVFFFVAAFMWYRSAVLVAPISNWLLGNRTFNEILDIIHEEWAFILIVTLLLSSMFGISISIYIKTQ